MAVEAPSQSAARLVTVIFGAAFTALTIVVGPMHQTQFGADVLAFLDTCQRLSRGQVAHADFQSPLGAGAFAPFVAVMRLTGVDSRALSGGAAICLAGFTAWGWCIAKPRFSPWLASFLAIFAGLLAGTAYALDFGSWERPSYAMFYNRIAWAAFVILAVECSIAPREPQSGSECRGAFSTGAAFGLIALLKVNFAVASAIVIALGTLLSRRWTWRRFGWMAAGAIFASLLIHAIAPFSPGGYAREWIGLARIEQAIEFTEVAQRVAQDNAIFLLLSVVLLLVAWRSPAAHAHRLQTCGVPVVVIGAGLLISLANCQFAELPVFPVAALLLFELVRRAAPARASIQWQLLALVPAILFMLPHAALPLRELAWQQFKRPHLPPTAQIAGAPIATLLMTPWPDETLEPKKAARLWDRGEGSPHAFAQWVNDGVALLRPHVNPKSRVLSMDFTNPFPFVLSLAPPRGDHTAWHWGRTVGEQHHVAPEILFADADFVMVPHIGTQPATIAAKLRVYGPLLRERFRPIAESDIWTLWQKQSEKSAPIATRASS